MKTVNYVILASLLAVASFTTAASFSQEPPTTPTPSATAFELRTYTAAEGKLDTLNARFRNHTLKIFEKHGIKNIGYWTGTEGDDKNKIFYIIAYPDLASREKMLVNGIAKDPEFLKIVAESEKDGKLTTKVESIMLNATDYSPIK